jgi:transcriptional regulator with XRE-family HTH domain
MPKPKNTDIKKPIKKHPGGRPRKTDSFSAEQLEKLSKVYEAGYTDKQLCELLGINTQTINNYKKEYPEFFESLKRGKAIADGKVEIALFQRAVGYSHPDVHVLRDGTIVPIIKHYPPDPTSMIFWLKNRQPEKWRDKQEVELTKPLEVIITDYRGKN